MTGPPKAPKTAPPAPTDGAVPRPQPRRLGIFGGTFDPIHNGHIASALQVAEAFQLDRVLLVVSAIPPHKTDATPAPAQDRLAMVELAVASHPGLEASDLEINREGPSFTYDTLVQVRALHPETELFLILGADAYAEIETWYRPADVLSLAKLIVTTRPGYLSPSKPANTAFAANGLPRYDPRIEGSPPPDSQRLTVFELAAIDVSATEIRARIGRNESVATLLPSSVEDYIRTNRVYPDGKGTTPS